MRMFDINQLGQNNNDLEHNKGYQANKHNQLLSGVAEFSLKQSLTLSKASTLTTFTTPKNINNLDISTR